jgi:hypothetical protein
MERPVLFRPVRRRITGQYRNARSFLPNKDVPVDKGVPGSSVASPFLSDGTVKTFWVCRRLHRAGTEGETGFGHDPVFIPAGHKTFAEMTGEEKDRLSHRGKALEKLRNFLHDRPHL